VIHGHQNRAHVSHRKIGLDHPVAVPMKDGDPISRLDTEARQDGRQPPDPIC